MNKMQKYFLKLSFSLSAYFLSYVIIYYALSISGPLGKVVYHPTNNNHARYVIFSIFGASLIFTILTYLITLRSKKEAVTLKFSLALVLIINGFVNLVINRIVSKNINFTYISIGMLLIIISLIEKNKLRKK